MRIYLRPRKTLIDVIEGDVPGVPSPVPTLTSISTSLVTVDTPVFDLDLVGTGFVASSKARLDTLELATEVVSGTSIRATIPASAMRASGSHGITVRNPAPGGGTSSSLAFTVGYLAPTASSSQPSHVTEDVSDTLVTVFGTNFYAASIVRAGSQPLETTYVSSTQLRAVVPAGLLIDAGGIALTVATPGPGGGVSAPVTLTVDPYHPPAAFGSISPTSMELWSDAADLIVNGQNFLDSDVGYVDGAPVTTTFVSSTQLTLALPASAKWPSLETNAWTRTVQVFRAGAGLTSGATLTLTLPTTTGGAFVGAGTFDAEDVDITSGHVVSTKLRSNGSVFHTTAAFVISPNGDANRSPTHNATGVNGHGSATFDGVNDLMLTPAFSALDGKLGTLLYMRQKSWADGDAIQLGQANSSKQIILQNGGSPNLLFFNGGGYDGVKTLPLNAWGTLHCGFNGASSKVSIDLQQITTFDGGTLPLDNEPLSLGGRSNLIDYASCSNIEVAAYGYYTGVIRSSTLANYHAWTHARYEQAFVVDTVVGCIGDSQTAGGFGPTPYPDLLDIGLPGRFGVVFNDGHTGDTIADLVARSAATDAHYDASKRCIISLMIGTNNENGQPLDPTTPQSFIDACNAWIDARHATGWLVNQMTIPANFWGDKPTEQMAACEAWRQAVNTLLRNGASHADVVTDLGPAGLDDYQSAVDGTYRVDHVHFQLSGNQMLADKAASAVLTLRALP